MGRRGHQPSMGRRGHQPSMGRGVISQVWVGGHQRSMDRGVINQLWVGGSSTNYGGWYHHAAMGDRGIDFPTSMYRNSKSTELL